MLTLNKVGAKIPIGWRSILNEAKKVDQVYKAIAKAGKTLHTSIVLSVSMCINEGQRQKVLPNLNY